MNDLKVKLTKPHRPDCSYLLRRNSNCSPWYFDAFDTSGGLKFIYRDAGGRRTQRGGRRWFEVKCNSIDCDARAIVRADTIEDAIHQALG